MADNVLPSFIAAQNFCTGSQSDYSTCIANNMRFSKYLDDQYKPSSFIGLSIRNSPIPYLFGDVYTDLIPIGMANVISRVKMINDYGVVSFRCSDVFNRPALPLPNLQDLGIPAQDLLNIIGVDPTEPEGVTPSEFEGIPLSPNDDLQGWMYNSINLFIGYTTTVSNLLNKLREIKGLITGSMNYYKLPGLSDEAKELLAKSIAIGDKYIEYIDKIRNANSITVLTSNTASIGKELYLESRLAYNQIEATLQTDIVDKLHTITESTDFTTYDYSITQAVVDSIILYESDNFPGVLAFAYAGKQTTALFGIPPKYPISQESYAIEVITLFAGLIDNLVSEMLFQIKNLRGQGKSLELKIKQLKANESVFLAYVSYQFFYHDNAEAACSDEDYKKAADELLTLVNVFSLYYDNNKYVPDVLALYDEDDSDSLTTIEHELDAYETTTGKVASIQLYKTLDSFKVAYNIETDTRLTEINLGGTFKDAGDFYYADIAYAVGIGKLTNIRSIQIDDEYYKLSPGVDDDGDPVDGISDSGCTRYKFTRHVLPTYDVDVEMYVYPGTPDQPYCPTINSYHNYNITKYSGLFTKQVGDDMGVFIFKGYKPMQATVEEVIQLGAVNLNAINLNDPSLDKKSYDYMLMQEVKHLTNASSINGSSLTTNDFKYYLDSKIINNVEAANYPGLIIIEFKNFPIGSSFKLPKIKLNAVVEDPV